MSATHEYIEKHEKKYCRTGRMSYVKKSQHHSQTVECLETVKRVYTLNMEEKNIGKSNNAQFRLRNESQPQSFEIYLYTRLFVLCGTALQIFILILCREI